MIHMKCQDLLSLTFSEKLKKEIKMQPATNFVWHFKG